MNNKKNIISSLATFSLLLPFIASSAQTTVISIVAAVVGTATTVIGIIAGGFIIIMFVLAGFKYLTAQGNPQQVKEANQAVIWGLVGVGVVVLAWSIASIVANQITVSVPF